VERPHTHTHARREGSIFVLGGNADTIAYVENLRAENGQVTAYLGSLAWTPVGVVVGDGRQKVNIAADNVAGWVDQTFPPEDRQAFVGSLRDLEILLRAGWHAEAPQTLSEEALLNPEDVPDDVLDAIDRPPQPLVQCATCRRTCVRDDFVWNERQLCAWDYHAAVFGKRGPWRGVASEERLFDTLPTPAYVSPQLLEDVSVDAILAVNGLPEQSIRKLANLAIEEGGEASYMAVRTGGGLTLLRERSRT
jgi:hypothetical protein